MFLEPIHRKNIEGSCRASEQNVHTKNPENVKVAADRMGKRGKKVGERGEGTDRLILKKQRFKVMTNADRRKTSLELYQSIVIMNKRSKNSTY